MDIAITALRLDEVIEELKKEESGYEIKDLLYITLARYKKEFFNELKELLKDRDSMTESNREIVLDFFLIVSTY